MQSALGNLQSASPLPLTLAVITFTVVALAVAFAAVCVLMMLIILVQKPKGGGLSGAFGGSGGGESAFMGAKVGDFLTWTTIILFTAFVGLAMGLTWAINPTPTPDDAPIVNTSTNNDAPADNAGNTDTPEGAATDAVTDAVDDTAAGVAAGTVDAAVVVEETAQNAPPKNATDTGTP